MWELAGELWHAGETLANGVLSDVELEELEDLWAEAETVEELAMLLEGVEL